MPNVKAIENAAGGYSFVPGSAFASSGVIASPGMAIVRAVFREPRPLSESFEAVRRHLDRVKRPAAALCGMELRMPAVLSMEQFHALTKIYLQPFDALGLLRDGAAPTTRTNVVPTFNAPKTTAVTAFSYTVESNEPAPPSYVISGIAEVSGALPYPNNIVRRGETSPDAMLEKTRCIVGILRERLKSLGATWDSTTIVHLYSRQPIAFALHRELLAADGLVPTNGVIWYDTAPPVHELELELDLRRYKSQVMIDAR